MILLRRAPIGGLGGELGGELAGDLAGDLAGSSGVPVDPAELAERASAPAIGEEPEGFEVFLVRRRKGASFMASAFVVPGGGDQLRRDRALGGETVDAGEDLLDIRDVVEGVQFHGATPG